MLKLILDQVVIDGDNNIRFALGFPTEDFVSITESEASFENGKQNAQGCNKGGSRGYAYAEPDSMEPADDSSASRGC